LPSLGYRQAMRLVLLVLTLILAACSREAEVTAGNEQAVIDKANADMAAAEAEAAGRPAQQP
jgi:outer membrane biogenesis lipoprotein LolB